MCLLLFSAAAAICADQGSISGKILIAAGHGVAVPNAPVEAKNLETQAIYKAASAADGSYELNGLPAGTYEVSVENVLLFLLFHQGDVRVVGGNTARLDIRLDDVQLNTLGDGGDLFVTLLKYRTAPSGPAPRAGDGKPDLSGVWLYVITKPLGDAPQPLPWAEAASKQRGKRGRVTDLGTAVCLPGAFRRFSRYTRSFRHPL